MSLRVRLMLVTLLMVAVALFLAGWATHAALRSFLVDRVDRDLTSSQLSQLARFGPDDGIGPPPGGHRGVSPTTGPSGFRSRTVAQIRDASGTVVSDIPSSEDVDLPATVSPGLSTVDLGDGAGQYRVLAVTPGSSEAARLPEGLLPVGGTLVLALPLADVNDTLQRLLMIELAVGALTLGALAVLGLWLVRLGLLPLERIGATADAIAEGDLSQRVADDDPRTEVGRLGRTLNSMLDSIESAFAERRESERRLRQFVGDASHELQTPLTSVRGYAELFRRGASQRPDDLETTMRRIEAEAARMGVLVDDLLLLARLDEGRPIERRPVDLTRLVGELVGDARVVEPDRPIELVTERPVRLEGDDVRLRQVVGNLLSNARAHTPAAAPVTVRVLERGDEALIEVADSGPGLAPEHAQRVFERFFRADPSRARSSGGSGLGLSIVSAITEAHGGRTEVESVPGRGSTFRVFLPLPSTHRRIPRRPEVGHPAERPRGRGRGGGGRAADCLRTRHPSSRRFAAVELTDAIRKRRAVRTYTDRPVDSDTVDRLLRLALRAPSGGGQQAWSLLVVRDPAKRLALGELVIAGGATYFGMMRPQRDATDEEHAAWATEYAEGVLGTYRIAPVWIVGLLVPRGYPEDFPGGYEDDLISLAFAFENLMLAARAEGLGTVPTTAFQRFEKPRLRELLGIPEEVDPAIVSPLGYPEAFPTGLAPALKRNFRPWKALVHDDTWGDTRD